MYEKVKHGNLNDTNFGKLIFEEEENLTRYNLHS